MLIILGNSVVFFKEKLRIFFCTLLINLIISLKKYNIYLYEPTYFSKDFKNHSRGYKKCSMTSIQGMHYSLFICLLRKK